MAIETILVKLKRPSKKRHKMWIEEQKEFAKCVNECVSRLKSKEKLSSKNVEANLKYVIKNEAVHQAKRAISDFMKGELHQCQYSEVRLVLV